MNIRANQPAPTSDYAFYIEGFKVACGAEPICMLQLAMENPYARHYPAFEAFADQQVTQIWTTALRRLSAAGVSTEAATMLGTPQNQIFDAVAKVTLDAFSFSYRQAQEHFDLAYHIPPHVRVMAAAYRLEHGSMRAVRMLNASKAYRDTGAEIDRNHIDRARKAYAEGLKLWERTRFCDLLREMDADPMATHEAFDDGVFRALVEARQRAEERKTEHSGGLGSALFADLAKREEARGKVPADGIFRVAQRLDEEAGTPFQTIKSLALMASCLPRAAYRDDVLERASA